MNPKRIDLATRAIARAIPRNAVRALVLFGSVARDEANESSDIDLLVWSPSRRSTAGTLRTIESIEKAHNVKVSILVSRSETLADIDRQLLETILRQGKPLVGSLPDVGARELDLEPVRLLVLDLRGMNQVAKVQLKRELFGYRSRRKYRGKVYESRTRGQLESLGGRRIGRSLIVLPKAATPDIDRLLRSHGAHRRFVPAWIQRP